MFPDRVVNYDRAVKGSDRWGVPFGLVGNMVARLALVLAEGAHFEASLVAALGHQHGVGYRRRSRTA